MSRDNAAANGLNPCADFMSEQGRAAIFSEAAAEFERQKTAAAKHPDDSAIRLEAADAEVRYINELAIAARHEDVAPHLDWLTHLAVKYGDDTELAVIAATGMFDHIGNLGVAQRFDEALAERQRLKSFVANYPEAPDVQVRATSASENLEDMMGWEESIETSDNGSGGLSPSVDNAPTKEGTD